jgi:anti-anti-sigma factor
MNSAVLLTCREVVLGSSATAGRDAIIEVLCEGDITLPDFNPGNDPLAEFLGPTVFGRKILLDMERVGFLDTGGLSWLLSCHERCRSTGGLLVLHSVPPRIKEVLRLLSLDKVLQLADGPAGARTLAMRNPV